MLQPISTVQAREPSFRAGWNPGLDSLAANSGYGMIAHAVKCDDQGKPLFDLPLWLERSGAVTIPVDQQGRIALLRIFREALRPPTEAGHFPLLDWQPCGQESLELPRGFAEPDESPEAAARREVEEETGFATLSAEHLGYTNVNTTYYPFSVNVFLVRIDSTQQLHKPGVQHEKIAVEWSTEDEILQAVANNSIICGLTRSAFLGYLARTRSRPSTAATLGANEARRKR